MIACATPHVRIGFLAGCLSRCYDSSEEAISGCTTIRSNYGAMSCDSASKLLECLQQTARIPPHPQTHTHTPHTLARKTMAYKPTSIDFANFSSPSCDMHFAMLLEFSQPRATELATSQPNPTAYSSRSLAPLHPTCPWLHGHVRNMQWLWLLPGLVAGIAPIGIPLGPSGRQGSGSEIFPSSHVFCSHCSRYV